MNCPDIQWFAIRTRHEFRAEDCLRPLCNQVFLPKESTKLPSGKSRLRAAIPHVMFIRTSAANALAMEAEARNGSRFPFSFWIYRFPDSDIIQPIPEIELNLLRLLTADDPTRCEIFNREQFSTDQHVRITAGPFKDLTGYVQRVRKNKHVVVKIEGICMVLLPFIHPDFLVAIPD